jgi:predicted transcriptional regulator
MVKNNKTFWYRDSDSSTNLTSSEAEIMRVVWDAGNPVTVRDVYEHLREHKRIAYTTVMSIMNILTKKGFLIQDKSSTAYVYAAAVTDTEVAGNILDAVISKILDGAAEPMISRLLGSKKKLTPDDLAKLEDLLKKKK